MANEDRNSVWESRNHVWVRKGVIDMEIKHPEQGWIPFSAHEDDDETLALYMDGVEALGEYTGLPTPQEIETLKGLRDKASIRKTDLLFKMHSQLRLISEEDAMAAATSGVIPPIFEPLLEKYTPEQRLYLKMEFAGENRVARTWPVLDTFARAIYGDRADAVLDGLFGIREMPDV